MWILDPSTFFILTTTNTQLLNKGAPWRGAWEKDSKFIELFINALTKPSVVVLDVYASTCNNNHTLAFMTI